LSRVDVQSKHSLSDIGKSSEAMEKFTEVVTFSYCTNLGFDLLANQEITMKIKSQMTTMRKTEPGALRSLKNILTNVRNANNARN
jgi:hypothetical protein